MKQIGTFPTPYGVTVPVFEVAPGSEEFTFTVESTALTMGIHDPEQRRLFVEEVARTGKFGIAESLTRYGGHKCPRVPLPRFKDTDSVYKTIPVHSGIPIEAWVDATMECGRWCDRADLLVRVIGQQIVRMEAEPGVALPPFIMGLSLSMMLTATLEHLGETEIDCIEAASFYALSTHDGWRKAGLEWLTPFRGTWVKDWVTARPNFRRFATLCRDGVESSLPVWLTEVQR